jgi:hypothetical protein
MCRVEQIKRQIEQLDAGEIEFLRRWFAEYDSEMWDQQIERDAESGALEAAFGDLAERARRDHERGLSTELDRESPRIA